MLGILKLISVNTVVRHIVVWALQCLSLLCIVQSIAIVFSNRIQIILANLRNIVSRFGFHFRQPNVLLIIIFTCLQPKIIIIAQ